MVKKINDNVRTHYPVHSEKNVHGKVMLALLGLLASACCGALIVVVVVVFLWLKRRKSSAVFVAPPDQIPDQMLAADCKAVQIRSFSASLDNDIKQIPYSNLPDGQGHIFPDGLVSVIPRKNGSYVAIWGEAINYRSEATTAKLENHIVKGPGIYGYSPCTGDPSSSTYASWATGGQWLMWVYPIPGTTKWLSYIHTEEGQDASGKCAGGGNAAHKRIGITYSSDDGKTWSKPEKMIDIGTFVPGKFTGTGDCGGIYECHTKTWYCYFGGDNMLGIGRSQDPEAKSGSWQVMQDNQWVDALTATRYSPMNITPTQYQNMANVNCHFNTALNQYVMIGSPYGSNKQDLIISASGDALNWVAFQKVSMNGPLQSPIPSNPFYPFIIGDQSHYEAGASATLYYAVWDYSGPYVKRTMNYRTIRFT